MPYDSNVSFPDEDRRIHIRYQGHSREYSFSDLDIGSLSSDSQIVRAVSAKLSEPVEQGGLGFSVTEQDLEKTVIVRHEDGNMTFRPESKYGDNIFRIAVFLYGKTYKPVGRQIMNYYHNALRDAVYNFRDIVGPDLTETEEIVRHSLDEMLTCMVDHNYVSRDQLKLYPTIMKVIAKKGNNYFVGWSFRSPKDDFDYNRGLKIAMRAIASTSVTGVPGKFFLERGHVKSSQTRELMFEEDGTPKIGFIDGWRIISAWKNAGLWNTGPYVVLPYSKLTDLREAGIPESVVYGKRGGKKKKLVPNTGIRSLCNHKFRTEIDFMDAVSDRCGRDAVQEPFGGVIRSALEHYDSGLELPIAESGIPRYRSKMVFGDHLSELERDRLAESTRFWDADSKELFTDSIVIVDGE